MKGLNGVSLLVNSVGEFYFALDDFLVDHHRVVVIKGVDADEHFVEEDAEGPPVDRLGMAFIQNNLLGEFFSVFAPAPEFKSLWLPFKSL